MKFRLDPDGVHFWIDRTERSRSDAGVPTTRVYGWSMKGWHGYGTEHSMNLKLIGHFSNAKNAQEAVDAIRSLTAAAEAEQKAGRLEYGEHPRLFSDKLMAVMRKVNVHSLGYAEVEQFLYDVEVDAAEADVVVQTDEIDVMAFVKVLIAKGAKVEMYSRHDHESGLEDK